MVNVVEGPVGSALIAGVESTLVAGARKAFKFCLAAMVARIRFKFCRLS